MKHSVSYIRTSLRAQFRLSCRATAYVECAYYGRPIAGKAQEHLSGNAGKVSDAAAEALAFLEALPVEESAQEEALNTDLMEAARAAVTWENEMAALELCNPEAAAIAAEELSTAADDWWQREGRFEEELEERGEVKYFYFENECRTRFHRRELSAREYLGV